ncbi:MAG: crotonase/enoyl-CoA hydratase family protein [Pseudomonadota bacterium]
MSELIEITRAQGVLTVRMNRPDKKNALTTDMYRGLASAISDAEKDDETSAILILGVPGAFSAGNDIADFLAAASGQEHEPLAAFDFLEKIIMVEKPLIAGVDGLAIGVGTTMLMHCDYVIASNQTLFRTPFVDLGLTTEAGSSLIGPRIMGHHRAFSLLVLGEPMNAEEALTCGLVNRVVTPSELEEAATSVAAATAAKPAEALKITRDLVRGDRHDVLDRMRHEMDLFEERLKSDDARAAIDAFLNKGK